MKDNRKPGLFPKPKRCSFEIGKSSAKSFNQFIRALDPLKAVVNFPRHSTLFEEGRQPDGIYVLVRGKVKLAVDLRGGRTLILGIAQAGEVLGLSAIMSGKPAEFTAETLTPAQFSFVERKEFLRLVDEHRELCVLIVEVLSHQLREAMDMIHYSSGSQPAAEKLASLLASWIASNGEISPQGIDLKLPLTQEEIGQMIGVSRETVSRLLSGFEKAEILSLEGSRVRVFKREALEGFSSPKVALAESSQTVLKMETPVPDEPQGVPAGPLSAESFVKTIKHF